MLFEIAKLSQRLVVARQRILWPVEDLERDCSSAMGFRYSLPQGRLGGKSAYQFLVGTKLVLVAAEAIEDECFGRERVGNALLQLSFGRLPESGNQIIEQD